MQIMNLVIRYLRADETCKYFKENGHHGTTFLRQNFSSSALPVEIS